VSGALFPPVPASVDLPLDDYGRALISYSGTGTVTWDDGSSNALTFNAAQFPDGRIVVLGTTRTTTRFAGLARPGGPHYTRGLPVMLPVGDRTIKGAIVAVEHADHLHRRVMTHKSAEVLAELVVPKTDGIEGADLVGAVSDLGVALSVMRGTKVVWVYHHDFSGNQIVHTPTSVEHRERVLTGHMGSSVFHSSSGQDTDARVAKTGARAVQTAIPASPCDVIRSSRQAVAPARS
jgi:hypothetical protein